MIALLFTLLTLSTPALAPPPAADRVLACYFQEDDLNQTDPKSPGRAHVAGPKYLIAWKFHPLASFGVSKDMMEVHDPHQFLKGSSFDEQNFNSKGTGFFAQTPGANIFMIGIPAALNAGQMNKAQFVRTTDGKLAEMAFGYCQVDKREASVAFDFWKSQAEILP